MHNHLPAASMMPRRRPWALAAVVALTAGVYWTACSYEFVNFDDDVHVYQNRHVSTGITPANLAWAFGIHGPSQWHPLAWISHQMDCSLFGADPESHAAGGHHAINLLLHLINVVLVYLFVQRLTFRIEPALLTTALFAVHPLNVESVAWVSERRNVLCLAFFLWALLAYLNYVRTPGYRNYLVVCVLHALALMAKPLAVTFPCVLLLLDVWPLQRFQRWSGASSASADRTIPVEPRSAIYLAGEKLPLLALSLVASFLTVRCQQSARVVSSLHALPLDVRIANALMAYGEYLWDTVWPSGLCVFYPHPGFTNEAPMQSLLIPAAVSLAALTGISTILAWNVRRSPWLSLGWLWFVGTLVPMIGVVQVGEQQRADRYTYLPNIGLFLAVSASIPWGKLTLRTQSWITTGAALVVLGFAACAALQVGTWKNSQTLFEHALIINDQNAWAHLNTGQALLDDGQLELARQHFLAALLIDPNYGLAHYNLGVACELTGDRQTAAGHFEEAIRLDPLNADAWVRRGGLRGAAGQLDLAEQDFLQARAIEPDNVHAVFNLGLIWSVRGERTRARQAFVEALTIDPHFAAARQQLERLEPSLPSGER